MKPERHLPPRSLLAIAVAVAVLAGAMTAAVAGVGSG
jgi:hypothetical protein